MNPLIVLLLLPAVTVTGGSDHLEVLRQWDAARTAAYAAGDGRALAELYLPGSRAGRKDVELLADYEGRRLRVWQRSQVFTASLRRAESDHLELRVTDRTMTVIGNGVRCRALPTTLPVTRDVRFIRAGGGWLVESVRPVRPGAPR